MSVIKFVIIGALFLLSSCSEKKNDEKLNFKNENNFHEIKSFLGLKKGMSPRNVIDLLDSKKVRHSGVISSSKLKVGEDFNPEQYKNNQIRFIEVFNYPIGDQKIDKFHLFFFNDMLYHFSLFKSFSSKKTINDKMLNQGWLFKSKYGSIVRFINDTLIEKYGRPFIDSNLEGIIQDSPELNLDLFLTDNLNTGSYYSVIWRQSNDDDLKIYIDNHQELYSNSMKTIFYDCSFHILVDFSNEKIIKQIEDEGIDIDFKKLEKVKTSKSDI